MPQPFSPINLSDRDDTFVVSGTNSDRFTFVVHGNGGNDNLTGSSGDVYSGDDGVDHLYGDDGDDFIDGRGIYYENRYSSGERKSYWIEQTGDKLYGGNGNDTIYAGAGWNTIEGGDGNDWILVSIADSFESRAHVAVNYIYGDSSTNTTDSGDDVILSGASRDIIFAGGGDDRIESGDEGGYIYGNERSGDTVLGEGGNDLIQSEGGDDVVYGGLGNDQIQGGDGKDTLYTGSHIAANNTLEYSSDHIYGDAGDDDLVHNTYGSGRMIGGYGNDSYHLLTDYGNMFINEYVEPVSGGNVGSSDKVYIHWEINGTQVQRVNDDLYIYTLEDIQDGYINNGVIVEDFYVKNSVELLIGSSGTVFDLTTLIS